MWLGLPEGQPSSGEGAPAHGDPVGKEREACASTPGSPLRGRRARACSPWRPASQGGESGGPSETPSGGLPTPTPPPVWNSGGSTGAGGGSSEFSGPSRCIKLTLSPQGYFRGSLETLAPPSH